MNSGFLRRIRTGRQKVRSRWPTVIGEQPLLSSNKEDDMPPPFEKCHYCGCENNTLSYLCDICRAEGK